mmetsp:Transcript_116813/g.183694  ORF Transcript_116813/g.183694 Transcript_116813/m.183694 type:complete len:249 (+) Transcript_116813:93-839(+)
MEQDRADEPVKEGTVKDRIEIFNMDSQSARVSLKQVMECFGPVQGCHIGKRGVDNPIVRFVQPEHAEAAMEALKSNRVYLDGFILSGEWKLTGRAPSAPDPADEPTPALRDLLHSPERPALRDRENTDQRLALRDEYSSSNRSNARWDAAQPTLRDLALGDSADAGKRYRSRDRDRDRERRRRRDDRSRRDDPDRPRDWICQWNTEPTTLRDLLNEDSRRSSRRRRRDDDSRDGSLGREDGYDRRQRH